MCSVNVGDSDGWCISISHRRYLLNPTTGSDKWGGYPTVIIKLLASRCEPPVISWVSYFNNIIPASHSRRCGRRRLTRRVIPVGFICRVEMLFQTHTHSGVQKTWENIGTNKIRHISHYTEPTQRLKIQRERFVTFQTGSGSHCFFLFNGFSCELTRIYPQSQKRLITTDQTSECVIHTCTGTGGIGLEEFL